MDRNNRFRQVARYIVAVILCLAHASSVFPTDVSTTMNPESSKAHPRVAFETPYGRIVAEIFTDKAPITAANFLRYLDEGRYKGATFYRAVRHDNDWRTPRI